MSFVSKSYRAMEAKKLSQLIADFEKSNKEIKGELSEVKATMIVNFSGGQTHLPKILDGTEKKAVEMFIKIIEHYHDKAKSVG